MFLVIILKKLNKYSVIYISLLCIIPILIIISITRFKYTYGSNIDWLQQHIAIPDYFRNLFYSTGKLFPNFAMNLSGGVNIYYFSYYSFLSPVIMISYLLPFVSMSNYIIISTILVYILSGILFYIFLRNQFNDNISFLLSLLFLLSSSFLFHTHRHIMFINYMPFLINGLIGVNKYFEKNKSGLLIISIFLMILTSYYYSVCGIITILLYALYLYIKKCNKFNLKIILKFLISILFAILLSAFFLFPIIYVILNGRGDGNFNLNFSSFLLHIRIKDVFYSPYSLGLTSLFFIGLIYNILFLKKENKIICLLLMLFISIPFINYLLNGGLYLNGKVFIPLLPLVLYFTGCMLENPIYVKTKIKRFVLALIFIILLIIGLKDVHYLYFDITFTLILLFFYSKYQKFFYLFPIILLSLFVSYYNQLQDKYVSKKLYKEITFVKKYDIDKYIKQDFYRYNQIINEGLINYSYAKGDYNISSYSSTTNKNYYNSFYREFANNDEYRNKFILTESNNIFFNKFMGVRYILSDKPLYGYKKLKKYKYGTLYENSNVYKIGYASSHLLSYDAYKTLSYIEKLEANINNIITKESKNSNLSFTYEKLNVGLEKYGNLKYKFLNNHYYIESKDKGYMKFNILNSTDATIIIRFKMNKENSCKNGDTAIEINGVMNKLTCKSWKYKNNNKIFNYVISSNDIIKTLNINFKKGIYDISNIEIYKVDNSFFDKKDVDELIISNKKNITDSINGKINVKNDGYFIFTIPYDKGFNIYVDSKKISYEKVNNSFIGFKIKKGKHNIALKYTSPYSNIGKAVSIISLVGYFVFRKFFYKKI